MSAPQPIDGVIGWQLVDTHANDTPGVAYGLQGLPNLTLSRRLFFAYGLLYRPVVSIGFDFGGVHAD